VDREPSEDVHGWCFDVSKGSEDPWVVRLNIPPKPAPRALDICLKHAKTRCSGPTFIAGHKVVLPMRHLQGSLVGAPHKVYKYIKAARTTIFPSYSGAGRARCKIALVAHLNLRPL